MDDPTLRGHLDSQHEAFVDALRRADSAADVPGCPGWSVARLVDHVGRVQRSVTALLAAPAPDGGQAPLPHSPGGADAVDWYREGFTALVDELDPILATALADEAIESWFGVQPRRFWLRRMTLELAVHRYDAESAGPVQPASVDTALAEDGVDEFFEVFATRRVAPERLAALDGTDIHLHATDTGGEWTAGVADGTLRWDRSHTKAATALRGTASELFLACWGRRGPDDLDSVGDLTVARRWQDVLRF